MVSPRQRTRRAIVRDAALACGLVVVCLLLNNPPAADAMVDGRFDDVRGNRPAPWLWWGATIVTLAAVTLRRRRPTAMLAAGTLAAGVHAAQAAPTAVDLGVLVLLYTVAARCRRTVSLAALVGLVLAAGGWCVSYAAEGRPLPGLPTTVLRFDERAGPHPADRGLPTVSETPVVNSWAPVVVVLLALVAAWAVGSAARDRRAYLDQLRARAKDLEHAHERRAALAAATERGRISREMHDVVAHGLSVIVIQAQVAVASLDESPAEARTALDEIVAIGRESLADMRRVLAAVGGTDDAWHPPPGLTQLPSLLDRVRQAGATVHLRVEGTPAELPAAVDLSAYRIVQEALTNTIKHAGADAEAELVIGYGPELVMLEIHDNGRGFARASSACRDPHGSAENHGHGLRGMRERVRLLGGGFTAGPASGGGFTVRATLPLHRLDRAPPSASPAERTEPLANLEGRTT